MTGGKFRPGRSGNPGGRPALLGPIREIARAHTEEAIGTLLAVMRNGKSPASARVRAAELLLDRGWGRPEIKAEVGTPGSFEHLSDAEIEQKLMDELLARGMTEKQARAFMAADEQPRGYD